MSHTKTPWILDSRSECLKSDGKPVCVWNSGLTNSYRSEEAEANAAFIVKACNNHERLLDALRELVYATNNPHSTWETVREEVNKSIKVLDVIKAAQE